MGEALPYTAEALAAEPVFQQSDWYHRIELLPGLVTPGRDRGNLAVTRSLLRKCQVEGQSCLDVGAQDGLISLLLLRRGASRVLAYDRQDHSDHIELLRRALSAPLDYLAGEPLGRLRKLTRERGLHPFDLVVFSGVLYHMLEPLAGLATVRGLLRDGGLMVIETAALFEAEPSMRFNAAARYYPGSNYWMITVGCLEYLCRFLRMAPLDCAYVGGRRAWRKRRGVGRIGLVCRAVGEYLPTRDDSWLGQGPFSLDLEEYIRFEEVERGDKKELGYGEVTEGVVVRPDTGTIDLHASLRRIQPTRPRPELAMLRLGDRV